MTSYPVKYTEVIANMLTSNPPVDLGLQSYDIFDEEYRVIINSMIVNHYRFSPEIAYDNVDLFVYEMNVLINEEMKYFNQLYKSALLKVDVFINNKRTLQTVRSSEANDNEVTDRLTKNDMSKEDITTGTRVDDIQNNQQSKRDTKEEQLLQDQQNLVNNNKNATTGSQLESKTPNGQLLTSEISDALYASAVMKSDSSKDDNGNSQSSQNTKQNNKNVENENSASKQINKSDLANNLNVTSLTEIDDLIEKKLNKIFSEKLQTTEKGHTGISQSELLLQFRSTFRNIDKEVIDSLRDLFLYIY